MQKESYSSFDFLSTASIKTEHPFLRVHAPGIRYGCSIIFGESNQHNLNE